MSGIVGGINLRSSGLVNNSSASDGEVLTGTGAGLPAGFEEASGGGWTLLAEQATTSGSTKTFPATGIIPSGTKVIAVIMDQVSTSDAGLAIRVRIGDEDGITTSGYIGASGQMLVTAVAAIISTSDWNLIGDGSVAANNYSGICTLRLQDASNFVWSQSGTLACNTGAHVAMSAGAKTLSKELTQVQLYSHNTFDGGSVSVQYMS